jgi:ribosomal protein L29
MAKAKKQNYKDMTMVELAKELVVLRENLRAAHFKSEGARSKNVKEQSTLKRQVARILTEINHAKGQAGKNNKKQ